MARILFCSNSLAKFSLSWRMRAEAVRDAGYEVHLAAPNDTEAPELPGIIYHSYALERRSLNPFTETKSLWGLRRVIAKVKPDLIHAMTVKPNLFTGFLTAFPRTPPLVMSVTGLGCVFTTNGGKARFLKALVLGLYRIISMRANIRILFDNSEDLEIFQRAGVAKRRQLRRIPGGGVDLTRYVHTPEPEGTPLVVIASRMLWDKGIGEFMEAVRMLCESGVQAHFAVVGEIDAGNPASVPLSRIESWRDSGLVEWWGHQDNMVDVFAKSNIICLPSYREGMPRVLIEAAACGRPVVTTDVPGCREIVRDGENGYLVPARDAKALAVGLRRLIENPSIRHHMSIKSREIAEAEFSARSLMERLLNVYSELLV
jgi:glycosyltransferase involved in cell wall biosynthesis